jgi:hypothetical protein
VLAVTGVGLVGVLVATIDELGATVDDDFVVGELAECLRFIVTTPPAIVTAMRPVTTHEPTEASL